MLGFFDSTDIYVVQGKLGWLCINIYVHFVVWSKLFLLVICYKNSNGKSTNSLTEQKTDRGTKIIGKHNLNLINVYYSNDIFNDLLQLLSIFQTHFNCNKAHSKGSRNIAAISVQYLVSSNTYYSTLIIYM